MAQYEYIAVWDEDLGCSDFDPALYLDVVREARLEISQPAVGEGPISWPITSRVAGSRLHHTSDQKSWGTPCTPEEQSSPPCAAMVEVQAPVFTSAAWACVWLLLQRDLPHAFGLDLSWHVCAASANRTAVDAMGIVDATWVDHLGAPTLGNQGAAIGEDVNARRHEEWVLWEERAAAAGL